MKVFTPVRRLSKMQTLITLTSTIILLLVVAFLGRGIWRSNILPAYASWRYQSKLETTHTAEAKQANKALEPLGLNVGDAKREATCHLGIAESWHTSVYCVTDDSLGTQKTFATIPNAADNSIKQVRLALERNGWHGNMNVAGGQLLYYDKTVNGFDCSLQLWIASDKNRVTPRLYCSQTYYYLGNPYPNN